MRVRFSAWLVLVALAVCPALAAAQQTESRIVGKALDQSAAALPGVTVSVTSTETGAVRTTVTQGDGSFAVTNLGPGNYEVRFELPGFQGVMKTVRVGVGQIETADAQMGVAGVAENVTVSADAPVLDISSAKIGVNVSPEEVENLPVNGRNFANLMTLATGATSDGNGGWASVRFNGKSNQQNYLNYDGVDGTYVWDASPGYLNATGSQFRLQTSMESVAEFRVNSGLAPAESGLGAGGNITVISKSGSNDLRGSGFWYNRRLHRQHPEPGGCEPRLAGVQAAAVLRHRLRAGYLARI
ncbi:MAG: carboxypeptidase regulatory-like domain-containing protein [Vicinamibacterales bacterium]